MKRPLLIVRLLPAALAIAFVVVFACGSLHAQVSFPRLWDTLNDGLTSPAVALRGDAGYITTGSGFHVVDLSDPSSPRIARTITLPDVGFYRIRRAQDTILLVHGYPGDTLRLYSIANPLHPRQFASTVIHDVQDLDAGYNVLYTATANQEGGTFYGIDFSNPDSLRTIIASGTFMNGYYSVQVDGPHVHAFDAGLDQQVIKTYYRAPGGGFSFVGAWEVPEFITIDADFRDSMMIYVGRGKTYVYRMVKVSRQEPSRFRLEAEYDTLPGGYHIDGVEMVDSLVVLRAELRLLPSITKRALITAKLTESGRLEVLDVLDVGLLRDNVDSFAVDGRRLFWSSVDAVHTGRIEEGGSITRLGRLSMRGACYDVEGVGREVYAVATDSLMIYDMSDPASPALLSTYPWRAEGVTVVDTGRVLLFDSVLALFDVGDPRSPRLLDTLHLGYGTVARRAVARKDGAIAIPCLKGGTHIVQVEGDSLRYLSRLPESRGTDAYWHKDALYVTEIDTIGAIWNVENLKTPRFVRFIDSPHWYWKTGYSLAGFGDTLSMSTGRGINFYDVRSPLDPSLVLSFTGSTTAMSHEHYNGRLYIEERSSPYVGDFLAFESLESSLGYRSLGRWVGIVYGDGRFFVNDSLVVTAASGKGLIVHALQVQPTEVKYAAAIHSELLVLFHPNPSSGRMALDFQLFKPSDVSLAILDVAGRQMLHRNLGRREAGMHSVLLDIVLSSGNYIGLVQSGDDHVLTRLIIQ